VTGPTPYPEVNILLAHLLAEVRAVLADRFVGLYLHGSLAAGEFDRGRSDIDFVVVTAGELPPEMLPALAAMHTRLRAAGAPWAEKLEGSYIHQSALRRHDPAGACYPALRVDGSFDVDGHGSDWVLQLHVLREQGVALAGPPPKELIDPAGPDDLRRAARATLREWWAPKLADPTLLRTREYQAYAVLTMCRALYTLQFAAVVPKSVAAGWARERLGERWGGAIDRALAWPHGEQPDGMEESLELIRLTLESAERGDLKGGRHRP
jgi:hypothetical protein